MIYTKCILCDPKESDGERISVMSRHTCNDGITPDPRITPLCYKIHLPEIGPSPRLIGEYYKRNLPWQDFEKRYLQQIRDSSRSLLISQLAEMALHQDLTLLCIEKTTEHCHRRLLAEEMQRYEPTLAIVHL